jgi:hypothetical protein
MGSAFSCSRSVVLVPLLALCATGCSPEAKANRALEAYVTVFQSCKDTTEVLKKKPGEHDCAAIASSAVDMGLEQTKLEEPRRTELLNAWLEKKKFIGYYLPRDKRSGQK